MSARIQDRCPSMPHAQVVARLLAALALAATTCVGNAAAELGPGPAASAAHATAPFAAAPTAHDPRVARKKASPALVERIDINSANAKHLMTLPGIGKAEARKIIANRPYLSKAELVQKGVLPTGPYLSLKDRVIALQKSPPKAKP